LKTTNTTGHQPITHPSTNGDDLKKALHWFLADGIFAHLRLHGNVKWRPTHLVTLAIFWVWSPETSLVAAAKTAIAHVLKLFGVVAVTSYQALTGALSRYSPQLLPILWKRFHHLFQDTAGNAWRIGRWLPLAADGSRVSVPRTQPNEQRFCKPPKKRNKKKANKRSRQANRKRKHQRCKSHYNPQAVGPQLWLTLVWHIGMRLPWCWKVGPSFDSERGHLLTLLQEQAFPEDTLFCADAGFYGYDFWRSILQHKHQFLVRVGSNVRLLSNLGVVRQQDDIVYCWPAANMKKKQPPLVLRLFRFHDGRSEVYLVSSVLDEKQLSAEQASQIYRSRWGIEVQFRSLKQTFGRSKLRSRTPEHAEIELHWSLVGLTLLQLLAWKEQKPAAEPAPQTSLASVLQIVRSLIAEQSEVRACCASLERRLSEAKTDSYQRHTKKKSRNYPRRKQEPSAGAPIITLAQESHLLLLRKLEGFTLVA
jgi:Transposase DDE domain